MFKLHLCLNHLAFFSSAEEPAELAADFDLLLLLLPDVFLFPVRSPPDLADEASDPESEEDPEPLEPLEEDDEDPLEEDPDPELEDDPSPVPSSSDEDPPDAEEADLEFRPAPPLADGRLGGMSF